MYAFQCHNFQRVAILDTRNMNNYITFRSLESILTICVSALFFIAKLRCCLNNVALIKLCHTLRYFHIGMYRFLKCYIDINNLDCITIFCVTFLHFHINFIRVMCLSFLTFLCGPKNAGYFLTYFCRANIS